MADNALLSKYRPKNALADYFVAPGSMTMTAADRDLYAGAAYGTPHEPFVRGDIAYRQSDRPIYSGDKFETPRPVPGSDETASAYAEAYARSMRNPILANGLDFSRIGLFSRGGTPHLGPTWSRILPFNLLKGSYQPETDVGFSSQDRNRSPGANLSHEQMHRGLTMLDIANGGSADRQDGASQHSAIDVADYLYSGIGSRMSLNSDVPTQDQIDRYRLLETQAQQEIMRRQHRMGPR